MTSATPVQCSTTTVHTGKVNLLGSFAPVKGQISERNMYQFEVRVVEIIRDNAGLNRPFPSSRQPPLQSESKCEVFVMVISSTFYI